MKTVVKFQHLEIHLEMKMTDGQMRGFNTTPLELSDKLIFFWK